MTKLDTRSITALGLLVAVEIVLSRFCSINAWDLKIGFSFLPVAVAAMRLGPLEAAVVAAVSDFVGAVLFPIGAYFPGFTLTAFLSGLVFGWLLHRRRTAGRVLAAVLLHQLVLGLLINSFWISVLYSAPYVPLLGTRVLQCAVLAPVEFLTIGILARILERFGKQAMA